MNYRASESKQIIETNIIVSFNEKARILLWIPSYFVSKSV
jgi:hypothetical protein